LSHRRNCGRAEIPHAQGRWPKVSHYQPIFNHNNMAEKSTEEQSHAESCIAHFHLLLASIASLDKKLDVVLSAVQKDDPEGVDMDAFEEEFEILDADHDAPADNG
jgi:hypothetical protein